MSKRNLNYIVLSILIITIILDLGYMTYSIYISSSLSEQTWTQSFEVSREERQKNHYSILMHGDSIAAGVGVNEKEDSLGYRTYNLLKMRKNTSTSLSFDNLARSGNKLNDVVEDLQDYLLTQNNEVDLLLIVASSNDVFYFTSLDKIEESSKELVKLQQKTGVEVVFAGPGKVYDVSGISYFLKPIYWLRAREVSSILELNFKDNSNINYINPISTDMGEYNSINLESIDNIHPNTQGHRYWSEILLLGIENTSLFRDINSS